MQSVSKRFGPLPFRGSTQENSRLEIFRFDYGKAANDKKVPDPVGSGVLYYITSPNDLCAPLKP